MCQSKKDGFHVSSNNVLCYNHFMEKDIEKLSLRWMLLPGFVSLLNVPGKTTTPKQERKLPIKRQITVKPTSERTQKT